MIGLSLPNAHLSHVNSATRGSSMWKSILDVLVKETVLNRLTARHKFHTAKMLPSETIMTYTNRVRLPGTALGSIGVNIDEQELPSP